MKKEKPFPTYPSEVRKYLLSKRADHRTAGNIYTILKCISNGNRSFVTSQRNVAKMMHLPETTARRGFKVLEQEGVILWGEKFGKGCSRGANEQRRITLLQFNAISESRKKPGARLAHEVAHEQAHEREPENAQQQDVSGEREEKHGAGTFQKPGALSYVGNLEESINTSTDEREVYEHWQKKGIVKHTDSDKHLPSIRAALERLRKNNMGGKAELKTAIDNYHLILTDDAYYWTHKWELRHFIERGLDKFLPGNFKAEDYLKNKDNGDRRQYGRRGEREEETLDSAAEKALADMNARWAHR